MGTKNKKGFLEQPIVRVLLTLLSILLLIVGIFGFFAEDANYIRSSLMIGISLFYLITELTVLRNPKVIEQEETELDLSQIRINERAFWWQRLLTFVIDYIICTFITVIIVIYFNVARNEINFYFLALIFIYYFFLESFTYTTIGKLIFRLKVVEVRNWGNPGFSKILIRTLCRFIPFDAFTFFSKKPAGWHDKLSGTVVIKK